MHSVLVLLALSAPVVSGMQTILAADESSAPLACDVFNPAADSGLTWDSVEQLLDNRTLRVGRLRVPLSPHPQDRADTPYYDLEVAMATYPGVENPEPLFNHNGGPGSTASSATALAGDEYKPYAVWGITQRGVRWWRPPSADAAPTPMFECDVSHMRLPPSRPRDGRAFDISDFTSCPCAMVDGTPLLGQSFANIDPENVPAVRGIFEKMAERGDRCVAQVRRARSLARTRALSPGGMVVWTLLAAW